MVLNAFYDETRVDVESHAPGATQIFLKFTSPTNRALFPREKGKGNSRNFVKSAFNDQNRNQPACRDGRVANSPAPDQKYPTDAPIRTARFNIY